MVTGKLGGGKAGQRVVLQVRDGSLHVLLWQRGTPPFEGRWALPGGPLGAAERLGTSLGRHLATKVDLTDIEESFVEVAAQDGASKGIRYGIWRKAGVSADVLKRAGIAR